MPNKKKSPVAGKTVAGKNNLERKKEAKRKRSEAEKYAKQVLEEKERKRKQLEKRSREIRRQRAKEKEKINRAQERKSKKKSAKRRRKNQRKNAAEKFRYYTSSEFLKSFNYFRIITCIIIPLVLIITGCIRFSQSVFVNVPSEIRSARFSGRIESENTAQESIFNVQQQKVFMDALKTKGSRKFDFYINSVVDADDNFATIDLCFGNPKTNDCILIATVYDRDGTVLYRSLGLEPGREINSVKLFEEMNYGIHDVKVAVNAYNRETNEKIGTQYAKIKIAVGVEYNGEK